MTDDVDKEELYRRLAQSRRLVVGANDQTTTERLTALIIDLEKKIADVEAKSTDAPPSD